MKFDWEKVLDCRKFVFRFHQKQISFYQLHSSTRLKKNRPSSISPLQPIYSIRLYFYGFSIIRFHFILYVFVNCVFNTKVKKKNTSQRTDYLFCSNYFKEYCRISFLIYILNYYSWYNSTYIIVSRNLNLIQINVKETFFVFIKVIFILLRRILYGVGF